MRYTAEILPYHDYPLEIAIRELARLGFTEVNLWSSAHPLAAQVNPGDDPSKILAVLVTRTDAPQLTTEPISVHRLRPLVARE